MADTFSPPKRQLSATRARCIAALFAAGLALTGTARAGPAHAPRREDPTEALRSLVARVVALNTELAEEEARWAQQKDHLERTREALEKRDGKLTRDLAATHKKQDASRTERERAAAAIATARGQLSAIDTSIRSCGARLLRCYEGLPEPLRGPLQAGAERVRAALYGKAETRTTPDRLQLVSAFAADLNRVSSSPHAVKQTLDVPGSGRREMDVLYLGGALGYYVSPRGDAAGLLVPASEGWAVHPRNELAPMVRRALAILSKERPAAVVRLPAPAHKPSEGNAGSADAAPAMERDTGENK